jgi:hypothetical protein
MKRWLSSIVIVVAAAIGGCGSDGSLDPIGEGNADVVSAQKLAGVYKDGEGQLSALNLAQVEVEGRKTNRYEAERIVQCVRAPCPTVTIKGKWFARDDTMTLYPDSGFRETYRVKLEGRKLALFDADDVLVAELTRQIPAPAGIQEILARHGVPEMRSEIDGNELDAQERAPGLEVKFSEAFDAAVKLFLTEESGLAGNAFEFEDELREECGDNADLVRCLANSPRTSVSLMKRDETAPDGESPRSAWVITFFVDDFTDHGYYAIVPKKRGEAPYVYAFN